MGMKSMIKRKATTQKTEMADSHCHLDLIDDRKVIDKAIGSGVTIMITNGVDTRSNKKSVDMADNRYIFAAMGVDPEHAELMDDDELELNIKAIRENARRIVAIGEIGLDNKKAGSFELVAKQRTAFEKQLDLARELNLPVCVHARNAIEQVLQLLEERGITKAQLHFFEGDVVQAKRAEKLGYMISIPPLDSDKRKRVVKEVSIDNIMVESDAPAAGGSPAEVKKAIEIIAEAKGLSFEKAAETTTANAKRFFNLHAGTGFIRA